MSFPQRCKVCGKRDKFNFSVPDDIWAEVVPEPFRQRVVCLGCFDAFASQKGVQYVHTLSRNLHFAGDAANLTLEIRGCLGRPE